MRYHGSDCFAHYTTTYDSTQNSFTLFVDSAVVAQAVSYNWSFGDGSTSTLATPSHIYSVDTVYNVCMKIHTAANDSCTYCHQIGKDYLGNIIRSAGFTINVKNGITTTVPFLPNETTGLVVYPNPGNGKFTVNASNAKQSKLIITNILGESIYSSQINSDKTEIDLSNQPKGVYFIKVSSGKVGSTQKLLIQ